MPQAGALRRLGFLIAIFGVVLAVSPALYEPFVILKLAALSAGLALVWLGMFGSRPRGGTVLDRPLAALWAVMLASAAVSGDRPVCLFGAYPQLFYGLIPLGLCTALYYAAAAASGEPSSDELIASALAASIPLSVYGIVQGLAGDPLLHLPLPAGDRIISTIGSPVMLGACLVLLIPVALHWAVAKKSSLGRWAGALMAAALLLTWSRGAWLSAGAAVALYLQLTGRLNLRARHWLGLAAGALLLLVVASRLLAKSRSDAMRFEILNSTAPMIAAQPLLGWGPDNFLNAFRANKTDAFLRVTRQALVAHPNAHDDLIQAAVTLGLLGLLAYGWLLWALALRLWRLLPRSRDGDAAAVAAALAGLFIQAKVNPIPLTALALAALLAGIVCREGAPEAAPPKRAGRAVCALVALLCAASAALWTRFYAADAQFRRGAVILDKTTLADKSYMDGVAALRRANELNPWVIDYARQRLDVIFRTAALVSPEQGRQLIEKALSICAEQTRLHPGNSSAHELYATALELMERYGVDRLAQAEAEIKTASEQDPTALFTLQRRIEIARALRDQPELDAALAQYRRVVGLTGEDPNWVPLLK